MVFVKITHQHWYKTGINSGFSRRNSWDLTWFKRSGSPSEGPGIRQGFKQHTILRCYQRWQLKILYKWCFYSPYRYRYIYRIHIHIYIYDLNIGHVPLLCLTYMGNWLWRIGINWINQLVVDFNLYIIWHTWVYQGKRWWMIGAWLNSDEIAKVTWILFVFLD